MPAIISTAMDFMMTLWYERKTTTKIKQNKLKLFQSIYSVDKITQQRHAIFVFTWKINKTILKFNNFDVYHIRIFACAA